MVLIKGNRSSNQSMHDVSFRPLAGIMVLIDEFMGGYTPLKIAFPSPCGDYGSYPLLCW